MKRIHVYFLFAFLVVLNACSDSEKENTTVQPEQTELPPSLKDETEVAFVKLTRQQQQDLQIELAEVASSVVNHLITAPGVVFPAPKHASIISAPIAGQIREINKYEGNWVQKGEVLFHIQSLEYGTLVSEYLQAHAEEQFQTNRLKRIKQLVEETISSVSELERATAEYERASASVKAAYSKLKALGVLDEEIEALVYDKNIDPVLHVHAPISGMVETNFVELGQSVNALENLARVLDTRVVLVRGYVSPDDARLIAAGDTVNITKREEEMASGITATISSINPGVDENSRSVVVNILISTSANWPRPGENVRVEIISSSPKEIIAIPVEALSYDGNQAVVFVQKEPNLFEKRPIRIAEIGARNVFVEEGLQDGERVAISKVFSLKALSRYEIIAEE
jgi:cobalt-zinc-cadmium efflux system membrane fusion protein